MTPKQKESWSMWRILPSSVDFYLGSTVKKRQSENRDFHQWEIAHICQKAKGNFGGSAADNTDDILQNLAEIRKRLKR